MAKMQCGAKPDIFKHATLPHFGSAMKRATSFTACCTSTRLMDMQLALIVALLNVDARSLSIFVSICGVHLCLHRWRSG